MSLDALTEAKRNLVLGYRMLGMHGLGLGLLAHLTARLPGADSFWTYRFGQSVEEVTLHSLCEADFDAHPVDPAARINPTLAAHGAIYRRHPRVLCIAVVLFLGTALDSTSTVLIVVPIFAPIFAGLGANLVWVGIITMIAVEIGLITPPLGMSPFVVKASLDKAGLGRGLSLNDVYAGALPFAAAGLLVIALIVAFPALVLAFV